MGLQFSSDSDAIGKRSSGFELTGRVVEAIDLDFGQRSRSWLHMLH